MGSVRENQRGFVHSRLMDLIFLFVLILLGIGAWNLLATLVTADFALAFFLTWLMAAATAWWWTHEQALVLRIPAGFLLFLCAGSVLFPLSWWSVSKLAVVAEAAVLAVGARYLGALWSERLAVRIKQTPSWYLDQSINLIDDLARWVGISAVAWFVVGVLPLLLVVMLPLDWVPWGALVWAFACMAWYVFKFRPSRVRMLKIPLGLWVLVAAAVVLRVFQQQIVGPMEAGSIGLIAYVAYQPVVIALFVEILAVGTKKT